MAIKDHRPLSKGQLQQAIKEALVRVENGQVLSNASGYSGYAGAYSVYPNPSASPAPVSAAESQSTSATRSAHAAETQAQARVIVAEKAMRQVTLAS